MELSFTAKAVQGAAAARLERVLDKSTASSTGLLCWQDFHPRDWQLDFARDLFAVGTRGARQKHSGSRRTRRGAFDPMQAWAARPLLQRSGLSR